MTITPWEGLTPRKWQAEALPAVVSAVRRKESTVVSAIMGAGKSYLVAELCRLAHAKNPDRTVVVAAPTQALVRQLSSTVRNRCGASVVGQFYGVRKQADRPIVVACNPSLENLVSELAMRRRRVSLFIQDECHSSEAASVRDVVPLLQPAGKVGFTATPFRSCSSESLSLWDSIAYRYTLGDALEDGVLVPWRTVNYDGTGSDDVDDVCVRMIRAHGQGPGIVSALTIEGAEQYAERLRSEDIAAEAIHSQLHHTTQTDQLERLKAGELRCLVHVSLLSEGVDFPWLRWLCLRRPVSARVRFMQELGRVLRCHPGKSHAVVMDPHDLLGTHGVQHAEALGQAMEAEAEREERRSSESGPAEAKPLPPAKALDASTTWARGLLLALQASGAVPASAVQPGSWRTRRPSRAQLKRLATLGRYYARYLPDAHREAVLALSREHVAAELQSGAVSDLISVLAAVAAAAPDGGWQARQGWKFPWPVALDIEPVPVSVVQGLPRKPREAA